MKNLRKKTHKGEKKTALYGVHRSPFYFKNEHLAISVSREGEGFAYQRVSGEESMERLLLSGDVRVIINPVEPLNCPMFLTPLLLLEMERPILVEPVSSKKVYLKFPIEIGVFIIKDEIFENIDIFSIMKQKFTLYGDPKTGRICKYWKSAVHLKNPPCDPISEGILELTITNTTGQWMAISRTVLDGYMMKIHYNNDRIEIKANMKVTGHTSAETSFPKTGIPKGMKRAAETLKRSNLSPMLPHIVMEDGL